jgi:ABC-type multidrug transport system fused ATPase/permease subunit
MRLLACARRLGHSVAGAGTKSLGTGRHGPAKFVRALATPRSPLSGAGFVTLTGGGAGGVSVAAAVLLHRGLATGGGRKPASPGKADGAHANEARRLREVDERRSGIESLSVQGEIGSMARRTWNVIKGVWTEAGGGRSATGKCEAGSSAANAPGAVPGAARLSDRKRAAATIGRVLQLAQPEKKILALALASMLITTPMTLIMPAAVGQLLDVSVSADAVMSPLTVAGMLLGVFAVQGVFMSARDGLLAIAGERIAARLRTRTYAAILRQDMTFFDHSRTGELVNRLSSDVAVVQKALTNNVTSALRAFGMALGGTGMMIHTCPKLAFVSLLVLPLGGALAVFIGRFLKRKQREVQDMLAATAQRAEECLTHMRLVRAFARERDEVHEYEHLMLESREVSISIGIASALLGSVIHVAANVALAGVLGYGGTLVLSGEITVGRLTSFLLYSIYVGFNFGTLSTVYSDLMKAAGAAEKLFYLMDKKPDLPAYDSHAQLRRLENYQASIEFVDVGFAYPTRPDVTILNGLSVYVAPGQVLGLVGTSGSGKSTLMQLLTLLYQPTRGRVLLDGVDIQSLDPSWLRSEIGVVQQESALFGCSIADNIRYGKPLASDAEVLFISVHSCEEYFFVVVD